MSVHIEWSDTSTVHVAHPGDIVDGHGSTNRGLAVAGDGFCIEGSRDEILVMLDRLRYELPVKCDYEQPQDIADKDWHVCDVGVCCECDGDHCCNDSSCPLNAPPPDTKEPQ